MEEAGAIPPSFWLASDSPIRPSRLSHIGSRRSCAQGFSSSPVDLYNVSVCSSKEGVKAELQSKRRSLELCKVSEIMEAKNRKSCPKFSDHSGYKQNHTTFLPSSPQMRKRSDRITIGREITIEKDSHSGK